MFKYFLAPPDNIIFGANVHEFIDTSLLYTLLKRIYLKNINKNHSKSTYLKYDFMTHDDSQKSRFNIKNI